MFPYVEFIKLWILIDHVKKFQSDSFLSNFAHHIMGRVSYFWSTRWSTTSKLLQKDVFLEIEIMRWRIQDFPQGGGGGHQPNGGGANLLFWPIPQTV